MKKKYALSLLSNLHTSIKTPIKWKIILFFLHKHAIIQFKYHKIESFDIRFIQGSLDANMNVKSIP